ncbi:hypothetical protein C4J81_12685 [Deltaproteobacteria bacterium Smac51]|nr:hypothetical protein C4J81_12685 [Deltaproteobacteria bacterium Smac51]
MENRASASVDKHIINKAARTINFISTLGFNEETAIINSVIVAYFRLKKFAVRYDFNITDIFTSYHIYLTVFKQR